MEFSRITTKTPLNFRQSRGKTCRPNDGEWIHVDINHHYINHHYCILYWTGKIAVLSTQAFRRKHVLSTHFYSSRGLGYQWTRVSPLCKLLFWQVIVVSMMTLLHLGYFAVCTQRCSKPIDILSHICSCAAPGQHTSRVHFRAPPSSSRGKISPCHCHILRILPSIFACILHACHVFLSFFYPTLYSTLP